MTNKHAKALGKMGRARNSDAQRAASRSNGKKGGRPAKYRCACGATGASLMLRTGDRFECRECGRKGVFVQIATGWVGTINLKEKK